MIITHLHHQIKTEKVRQKCKNAPQYFVQVEHSFFFSALLADIADTQVVVADLLAGGLPEQGEQVGGQHRVLQPPAAAAATAVRMQ